MKLIVRLGILTAVIGLALLIAALNYPEAAYSSNGFETSQPNTDNIIFLPPQQVSIVVTSLNGTANLVVAPASSSLVAGNPIINATAKDKDVIVFSVQQRGFYFVYFEPASSKSNEMYPISFDVNVQGTPIDVALAGATLTILGVLVAYVWRSQGNRN